jgi:hypothetical protein
MAPASSGSCSTGDEEQPVPSSSSEPSSEPVPSSSEPVPSSSAGEDAEPVSSSDACGTKASDEFKECKRVLTELKANHDEDGNALSPSKALLAEKPSIVETYHRMIREQHSPLRRPQDDCPTPRMTWSQEQEAEAEEEQRRAQDLAVEALRARQAAIRERELLSGMEAEKREAELQKRRAAAQARQLQSALLKHNIELERFEEKRKDEEGARDVEEHTACEPEAFEFCEHCRPLWTKLYSPRMMLIASSTASTPPTPFAPPPLLSQSSSPICTTFRVAAPPERVV